MSEEQYQRETFQSLIPFSPKCTTLPTCEPFSKGEQIIHQTVLKHSVVQIRLANMAVNER